MVCRYLDPLALRSEDKIEVTLPRANPSSDLRCDLVHMKGLACGMNFITFLVSGLRLYYCTLKPKSLFLPGITEQPSAVRCHTRKTASDEGMLP